MYNNYKQTAICLKNKHKEKEIAKESVEKKAKEVSDKQAKEVADKQAKEVAEKEVADRDGSFGKHHKGEF